MSLIKSVRGYKPVFGKNCFLAENSTVIGNVEMGNECSVWFQTVIRGDVNEIKMGHRVNVQDGAVIHCTYEKAGTYIGDDVSIGHNAIVHGCKIDRNVLIGMGAIIMDNAHIQENTIVAAGAVVLGNSVLESGYIYGGIPAKKLKKIEAENLEFYIHRTAKNYIKYASWFKDAE